MMQGAIANNWNITRPLATGWRGTLRTLRAMAFFCRRDAASQELRDIALDIIGHVPGHDFQNEINALFFFVRNIRYRRDPVQVERVQDALRTLQFGTGDCDDKSTLLVSLLAAVGHRSRFVVTGPAVGKWNHVYVEVQTKRGWLALDPTPERAIPGWEQQAPVKAVFEIWPNVASSLKVIRQPVCRQSEAGYSKQRATRLPVAAFSSQPQLAAYLANRKACQCGKFLNDCDTDEGLGADTYEWKQSGDKCTLEKKKCGFFCKIGRAFKTVGKYALMVAPIALAPFTAGGSLALTGAAGTALTISSAAAASASSIIQRRYTGNLPGDAKIEEPSGACKAILEREATEEARKIAEAEQAKKDAEIKAQVQAALQKQQAQANLQAASNQGGTMNALTSNPALLAALIVGGAVFLSRK